MPPTTETPVYRARMLPTDRIVLRWPSVRRPSSSQPVGRQVEPSVRPVDQLVGAVEPVAAERVVQDAAAVAAQLAQLLRLAPWLPRLADVQSTHPETLLAAGANSRRASRPVSELAQDRM